MRTLSEIVSSALSSADRSMKLASARDAKPETQDPLSFLDEDLKLSHDAGETPEEEAEEKKRKREEKGEEKKSSAEVLSDAEYAMKLAQSLDIGASIVSAKLASDGTAQGAPGPQIMESGMISAKTVVPRASSNVSDRITGSAPEGATNGLPTTRDDFTSRGDESGAPHNHPGKTSALTEDWTRNKAAALRVLRAKTAEAEVLMNAGQHTAAARLLEDVKQAQAKLAQDPSSPQPQLPGQSESFRLDTSPGASSQIPDNAGLIGMTKAQAKDSTVRESTQHFSEVPKKDPATAAHTLRTDGAKISSIDPAAAKAFLARTVKTAQDPHATAEERQKAAGILRDVKNRLGAKADELLS